MRLLIVEDDALLADGLARTLRRAGHAVDCVRSRSLEPAGETQA